MRVCLVEGSLTYLTSSFETETFITGSHGCNQKCTFTCGYVVTVSFCRSILTGCHKGQPYVSDPKVKSFIQWTKTLKDNAVLEKTAVGGHYCYPHPPQKCLQAMADSSGEGK